MEEKIIEIIINLTGFTELKENKDINLLENEILDSLAFIELITTLEEEFNVEIQPTQVNPNTWQSVAEITELVKTLSKKNVV